MKYATANVRKLSRTLGRASPAARPSDIRGVWEDAPGMATVVSGGKDLGRHPLLSFDSKWVLHRRPNTTYMINCLETERSIPVYDDSDKAEPALPRS